MTDTTADRTTHARRLQRALRLAREANLTALALVPGANLRYLTDLRLPPSKRFTLALLHVDGTVAMIVPNLEEQRVQEASAIPGLRLYPYEQRDEYVLALRDALHDLDLTGRDLVGIEHWAMRAMELRPIEAALPGVVTHDVTSLFARLRSVKDEAELRALDRAARIVEEALDRTVAHIRPGVTERELATVWFRELIERGSDGAAFDLVVAGGPNASQPHHDSADRPFQEGDLILMDGGAVHDGYVSDITRVFALGEPGEDARRVYDAVLRANHAGRAACRPGATGAHVERAVRDVLEDAGYGPYILHAVGHGIGLEIHETPFLGAGHHTPLDVGTVFTVEPGLYVPGRLGIRIEDSVVVTPDGARSITRFPRELQVL
ncbi:M24 family metallopeptidase [Deinococcus pimensis]|uniref:M24 family metallopeptidase n=1 Tax=Deinococcus pimensis TaxID=309888 RepID=UPI000489B471|nr:Xaa-Pro peptidase family protein [Deinococcus pimensis]